MPASSRRTLTLLDAMLLVAATAVGLPGFRVFMRKADIGVSGLGTTFDLPRPWDLPNLVVATTPCLATWTLAVLALGLKPPRPTLRRSIRRPGRLACLAAASSLLLGATVYLAPALIRKSGTTTRSLRCSGASALASTG